MAQQKDPGQLALQLASDLVNAFDQSFALNILRIGFTRHHHLKKMPRREGGQPAQIAEQQHRSFVVIQASC